MKQFEAWQDTRILLQDYFFYLDIYKNITNAMIQKPVLTKYWLVVVISHSLPVVAVLHHKVVC